MGSGISTFLAASPLSSKLKSLFPFFMFGPSAWSIDLLCPLLTSASPSRHLSITVVRDRLADLPGYCALTFTLMPAASTLKLSVQVLDFEETGLLIQLARLLCGFCSSGQRFACGFLQIPPRDGHPCRPANYSPCRASRGLSPPSERALPGAPTSKTHLSRGGYEKHLSRV